MAAPAAPAALRKAELARELARIVEVLVQEYRPVRIILFGSLAQGAVHEWSDIDLAIIKETDKRFLDRIGEVLLLTQPTVGLEALVYTPHELDRMVAEGNYFMIDEILGRGRVLYDRKLQDIFDRFFKLPDGERYKGKSYTDPIWKETANRVFSPYVGAMIKAWEERGCSQ